MSIESWIALGLTISNIAAWRLTWSIWCINCELQDTLEQAEDMAMDHLHQIEMLTGAKPQTAATGTAGQSPATPTPTYTQGFLKLFTPHNN